MQTPDLTLVIPAYNEESSLRQFLPESLLRGAQTHCGHCPWKGIYPVFIQPGKQLYREAEQLMRCNMIRSPVPKCSVYILNRHVKEKRCLIREDRIRAKPGCPAEPFRKIDHCSVGLNDPFRRSRRSGSKDDV